MHPSSNTFEISSIHLTYIPLASAPSPNGSRREPLLKEVPPRKAIAEGVKVDVERYESS